MSLECLGYLRLYTNSLCRGIVDGGAILHPTENSTHPSGASRRALENGCLGFFAASNTHIYISFAVNHVFPHPFGISSYMFPSSSKENISPLTPRPYQPGCPMSFEQWQKSEGNRIKALTIRKDKSYQDPL